MCNKKQTALRILDVERACSVLCLAIIECDSSRQLAMLNQTCPISWAVPGMPSADAAASAEDNDWI